MCAETTDDRLPIESDSQRIGQEAVQAFIANSPSSWRLNAVDGDTDFGLDQQLQIVDSNKLVSGGLLHVQIKGSEAPAVSADNSFISESLDIKTLNYYARIRDPVLLVFADLSSAKYPKDCRVYWLWLSDEIRTLLKGAPDFASFDQDSLTFRIPIENALTPDFDVWPKLIDAKRQKDALDSFVHTIGTHKDKERTTAETVQGITAKINAAGPQLIKSITDSSDSPWIDPPEGSQQEKLHAAHIMLGQNNDVEAESILEQLMPVIGEMTSHEKAEFHYLNGRVLSLRSNDKAALIEYEAALKEHAESEKYLAAVLEVRFRNIFPEEEESGRLKDLIAEFPNTGSNRLMALRARLQSAMGDHTGAADTLKSVDEKESIIPRILGLYLQEQWDQVIAECEAELGKDSVRYGTKAILYVLSARSYFYSAIASCDMPEDRTLPPFGLPGTDISKLKRCWESVLVALQLLREQNWPANSEHIVDIIGHVAPALGQTEAVLGDLYALSKARPNIAIVHEHLARLAAMTRKYEVENAALDALERLEGADNTIHLRIHSLYAQNKYQEAVSLAEQGLISANKEHVLHSSCLGIAAICAQEALEPGRGSPFLAELATREEWAGDLAVCEFVAKANSAPLEREAAFENFMAAYKAYPNSRGIQDNLFDALNAEDQQQAALCIEIGDAIRSRRLMSSGEMIHLAQAYTTHADWQSLLDLANEAVAQYGHLPRTVAIKAIALDGMGDSVAAAKLLEGLISEHPDEDLAITSYVNICIRTGFHEKAAKQVEMLYQGASSNDQKLTYLRQLFSLRFSLDPEDESLQELAWRYGRINDQAVEREEGIFLHLFIAATLNEKSKIADDRVTEFQARADRFFETWPNSQIIGRFELPGSEKPGELVAALEKAIGITKQQKDWYKKVENQLSDGRIAAPFCWRPRRLLMNIANVPHLWYVAKHSSKDARAYHLHIDLNINRQPSNLSSGPHKIPIVDLTTLLVLQDLGILKHLFSVFRSIALSVESALEIQQLAHPFLGGFENVAAIRDFLKQHVDKISNPSVRQVDDDQDADSLNKALDEIKGLVSTGNYSLYIDDSAAREYVSDGVEDLQKITTLDFLEELEGQELLTTREVGEKLAVLTRWNVGLVVRKEHFLSVIPSEVDNAKGIEQLIDALTMDGPFKDLADGLWDIRKDYRGAVNHIAAILADIAQGPRVSAELIAAIWEVWNIKVELRGLDITKERHRALALIRMISNLRENKTAVKKLWDAFLLLVERQHGDRMEIANEREARKLVGRMAADIVHSQEDTAIGSDILGALLLPFTSGTSEYDLVNDSYVQARVSNENS